MIFQVCKNLLFLVSIIFFISCDTEDEPNEPQLPNVVTSTEEAEAVVTYTSVEISGTISEKNGEVTSYGVVWAQNPSPTIEDNVIIPDGTRERILEKEALKQASNSFTVKVTDLIPGENYFFRTFATNEAGTSYGEEISIETPGLAGSSWEFTFRHTEENQWIGHVEFYEDGTAFYTEPDDASGAYDRWGEWSMEDNTLTYDLLPDDEFENYILTGEVNENEMSGTYTFGTTNRPWDAVPLSTTGE